MKIASVTFFPATINVSGAHTSSISFKEWCKILEIECEIIGVGVIPEHEFADENIERMIEPENISVLNEYDAIFFSSYPMLCEIEMELIKKPFMVMEHSEYEVETFGEKTINSFLSHRSFAFKITLNEWCPVCSPEYLWKEEIKPRKDFGMLYAARIFEMKNPILFMKLAGDSLHLTQKALMTGNCFKQELSESLYKISNSNGVKYFPSTFNKEIFKVDEFGIYWDVFGNIRKRVSIPRLNISAVEALHHGMIPIVNGDSIPPEFSLCFIQINPSNGTEQSQYLRNQIVNYSLTMEEKWDRVNSIFSASRYSYESVINQFTRIIEILEKYNA